MTKPKVFNLFSLTIIAICCFFAGIYAVLLHTTTTTTSVGFTATGISGTVTGTLGSADRDTFTGTAYSGTNLITSFSKSFDPKNGLTTENATWNVGELTFLTNENGITGYITLTLEITNTGSNDMYLTFSDLKGFNNDDDDNDVVSALGMQYVVDNATSSKDGLLVEQDSYQIKALPNDNNLTISFQLYVANEGLNMEELTFGLNFNLSPSGDDQVTPVVTTDSNIDAGASIIPAIATPGEDYIATLNFSEGYILDPQTTTVKINETATDYSWNPTAKTLTIAGSKIVSTTAPTLDLKSIGFSGGDGTTANPFEIATATQLNLLPTIVNVADSKYTSLSYKLTSDIELNPGTTFEFIADTGLVKVTQNTANIYIGTGYPGDATGSNTQFDSTASTIGAYYQYASSTYSAATATTSGSVITVGSVVLNAWTPIGLYGISTEDTTPNVSFKGNFNGDNYIIGGLFLNVDHGRSGMFAVATRMLQNIILKNGFIRGGAKASDSDIFTGGIAGCFGGGGSMLECKNYNIVVSNSSYVGGIVGIQYYYSKIINSENYGLVIRPTSSAYTGGICGYTCSGSSLIANSINFGQILSIGHAGNICGWLGYDFSGNQYMGCIYNCFSPLEITSTSHLVNYIKYTSEVDNVFGVASSATLTQALYSIGSSAVIGKVGYVASPNSSVQLVSGTNNEQASLLDMLNGYLPTLVGKYPSYKFKTWEIGENGYPTLSNHYYN